MRGSSRHFRAAATDSLRRFLRLLQEPRRCPQRAFRRSRRRHHDHAAAAWIVAATLLMRSVRHGVMYQRSRSSETGGASAAAPIRSLVVLPFENLTGDATQVYFVDAVTDALTTQLAQVEGLDVISRTSARQYQRPDKPLTAIGEELNVDAVVEGSLVRSGTRVRVTTQLVRVVHGSPYLGAKLRQRVGPDAGAPATDCDGYRAGRRLGRSRLAAADGYDCPSTPQAYEAYVKGVSSMGMPYESNRRAVAYFEEAIARQPDFAHAYAELAVAQFQFLFSGPLSPREAIPKAEAAATKGGRTRRYACASTLDPGTNPEHFPLEVGRGRRRVYARRSIARTREAALPRRPAQR